MDDHRTVAVYGAYGHTGRFVVAELCRRGWSPVLAGRHPEKLHAVASSQGELEIRVATVDSPSALDRVVDDVTAVINCAGPFAETAAPVAEAALRAGIPYLDVAAEIEAVADTLARYDEAARRAGVVVIPAMAFFGGLGDLLATAALGDWPSADEVVIAYGLDSWHPTAGTRAAGEVSRRRRDGRRVVYAEGRLQYRTGGAAVVEWEFPPPLGRQQVRTEFTMADSVTIPHHIATPEISSYMTLVAAQDVGDPTVPPPSAADDSGRSAQTFLVEVVVRRRGIERRAVAAGRDIYAFSAPLVVEAAERVVSGRVAPPGAVTAGEAFDALDVLGSLPLTVLAVG